MKLKNALLTLFSLLQILLCAQSSFYYNLNSENDFPFNQIYNITENKEGYILICTESGVYKFDGLEHQKVYWKNEQKDEILNFKKDEAGNIFGTGLKNNIYSIQDDTVKKVVEWGDSSKYYIRYFVNDQKAYLPSNSANIKYKDLSTQEVIQLKLNIESNDNLTIEPSFIFDKKLHFKLLGSLDQSLYTYNFESTVISKTLTNNLIMRGSYFELNNQLYFNAKDDSNEKDYLFKYDKASLRFIEIKSFYQTDLRRFRFYVNNNTLFSMGNLGLEIYNSELDLLLSILPKTHVTGVVAKGNSLWISTLNSGIYFIPNYQTKLYNEVNSNLTTTHLNKLLAHKNHIIFAEYKGSSWYLDHKDRPQLFSNKGNNNITSFSYSIATQSFLYGSKNKVYQFELNDNIKLIDSFPQIGNKDVDRIGNYTISANTIGSYVGIFNNDTSLLPAYLPPNLWSKNKVFQEKNLLSYQLSNSRCFRSFINPFDSSSWFVDGNGITRYDRQTEEHIAYNGNSLLVNDAKLDSTGDVWIATENKLYHYQERKIVQVYDPFTAYNNLFINAIEVYEDLILFSTNQGIFRLSVSDLQLKRWTKNDGLPTLNITKAAISKNRIYAISNKGLSIINTSELIYPLHNEVFINNIRVNNLTVSIDSINTFKHNENSLLIELGALDLRSFRDRTFYYRLNGAHSDWVCLVNNSIIRYPNLASGSYQFEVYVEAYNGQKSAIKSFDFEIGLPFWRTWWFILLITIVAAIAVYIYVTIRIKRIKREKELQNKIIQSEIDGLKSQMNPHFIFNALNSIQNLIIQKDVGQSNLYLGKFADLLRSVLQYSTKEKISLREEIELLTVYLELEQLRFKEKLQIQVICDENLRQFQIPPLLLQPYIENSLKHGLLHSTRKTKTLKLHFFKDGGFVICDIIDNGIGRAASVKINERRAKYHESYATKSLEKRINLINRTTEKQMKVDIIDLEDGTMVKISFPAT